MDIVAACKAAIEGGREGVILVVAGPPPRGNRIRLDRSSRRKCPMGEVANWTERDGKPATVARFNAIEVLAWLAAAGVVDVKIGGAS